MRYIINIGKVSFVFMSLALGTAIFADSAVWQIASGSSKVYLGGTVHLLRPSDYPLPREFELAYQASSEIYFETDLTAIADISVQTQMLNQLTYQDERTLQTVLSAEAYYTLANYVTDIGMQMTMIERFKPGMVISTLQVLEFERLGFTLQGVDTYFANLASRHGKPIGQLETVMEQIGFLSSMGEGNESEFILFSLEDLEGVPSVIENMITAWREGNNDRLAELFVNEMQTEAPALYDALLKQRNLNWIPKIEQMLEDSETEFVLVGAAHLVGRDGLLELLSAKGYLVRQI